MKLRAIVACGLLLVGAMAQTPHGSEGGYSTVSGHTYYTYDPQSQALLPSDTFDADPFTCRETRITSIAQPRNESMSGAGHEDYASGSGVTLFAGVNRVQVFSRVGDRVQVCRISSPRRSETCNPDIDSRGRLWRIYNYRTHGTYIRSNGIHTCGGA